MKKLYVINSRGEREPFSRKKLHRVCKRLGVKKGISEQICANIEQRVYPGISTSEIAKLARGFLSDHSARLSIRFSLKDAMRKLGPDGFDFEKYVAEVFSRSGFSVDINQNIPGRCISDYEIDFIAQKNKYTYIGEVKYHRSTGARSDLKVALYNYARFLDIKEGAFFKNKKQELKTIVVTNTKFTSKSIRYSNCKGIDLLGWRYPARSGLEKMIEQFNLYPITILPSFKGSFKNKFAQERMMLVLDILESPPSVLEKKLNLSINQLKPLIREAEILINPK